MDRLKKIQPLAKVTFMLDESTGLDDDAQLLSKTNSPVTARIIKTNVAGTIFVTDPWGEVTDHILAAGEEIKGWFNSINATGAATITAADLVITA